MKTMSRYGKHPEVSYKHAKEVTEATDFDSRRISQEMKLEPRKEEASTSPQGNYEYEQMIAEDANFNTKKVIAEDAKFNTKRMVAEAAFFIAERRGFEPGREESDWLQAEIEVEDSLHNVQQFNLNATCAVTV